MTVKQKQNILSFLGYYTGQVDGIWGGGSKAATRKAQEEHELPVTGEFDEATALALANTLYTMVELYAREDTPEVDNVWDGIKYFTPDEFKCKCGGKHCDGFPVPMSRNLLLLMDSVREHYDAPITISSGVRCQTHNAAVGGVYNSRHLAGKACDFSVRGKSASAVVTYLGTVPGVRYTYAIDSGWVHVDVD